MDKDTLIQIVLQVITSWQVIAITIAILLYIILVNHAAKSYHRPRTAKKVKVKKKKENKPEAAKSGSDDIIPENDSNDDLGLEEA